MDLVVVAVVKKCLCILGETDAFVSWDDPEPFHVGNIGVCTGWGACGNWIIEPPQNVPGCF